MYLEAKHLEDLLSFGWNIAVENTSNPPVMARLSPCTTIAPKDVIDVTGIKDNESVMTRLRDFLGRGVLTLINKNSWEHEKYDSKNRRREAILAQRERHGTG